MQSSLAVRLTEVALFLLQNPFGAAKPREAVLANRVGKKEEEILKEEVLKEKLQVSPDCVRHGAHSSVYPRSERWMSEGMFIMLGH